MGDGDCSGGPDGIEDEDPVDGDGSGPRGGVDREGDSNDEDVPLVILVSIASERQMGWRPRCGDRCLRRSRRHWLSW